MRNKQKRRCCAVACFVLISALVAKTSAQEYNHEIGLAAGVSSYMGDANKTNLLLHPHIAGGFIHRYNINFHWSVKTSLKAGTLSGDTKYAGSAFPNGERLAFSRHFADIGSQMEFSFFPYSDKYTYLGTKSLTPYLFAGMGFIFATGERKLIDANVPVGIGLKYKLKNRVNMGVEVSVCKLFSDGLDVVEKSNNNNLDAPYGIKSNFLKNNDWVSMGLFYITWEFGLKTDPCRGL